MGDETQEQKGTAVTNTIGPPTGMTDEEIAAALKHITLAPGFRIDVYASGVNSARQMAWATGRRCSSARSAGVIPK
jgi:hypothetical protein